MKTKANGHHEIVSQNTWPLHTPPCLFITPPDKTLLEKLADNHLVKKFPDFYGSGGSLVRSTEPNINRLFLAKSIHSIIWNRFFVTSLLILSPNLYALLFQAFSSLRPFCHLSLACYILPPSRPRFNRELEMAFQNYADAEGYVEEHSENWTHTWRKLLGSRFAKCVVARVCESN